MTRRDPNRRDFLARAGGTLAGAAGAALTLGADDPVTAQAPRGERPAQIAITFDLEMSREYPARGMTEWDYEKGNLDEPTKRYAVQAGKIAQELGGTIHYFCVGRVLEQPDIEWLRGLAESGHPIGNHTYDHVNVRAETPAETQFRFRRAPWLVEGRTARQIVEENIRLTSIALRQRAGITENGFRTPGGFAQGIADREDVQRLLLGLGYTWVSSKYPAHRGVTPPTAPDESIFTDIVRAQQESQPTRLSSGLVEVPMSPISDVNAFRSQRWRLDAFLEATRRSVQWAIDHGAVFDFLAHPSCLVVEDPEFRAVRLICDLVRAAGDRASICGLDTIAAGVE